MTERPAVPCPEGTTVVGDLHLDLFDEAQVAPAADWLAALAGAPRLVVLGDLFEFWVGTQQGRLPGARALVGALGDLVGRGTAVDVLHGNRDFLLGRDFERATGARVRPDGLVGDTPGGGRTLFVHGDELCTGDVAYQRYRRVVRSAPARLVVRNLPFGVQRRLAARLRRASERAVAAKPDPTKAMRPAVVERMAEEQGADTLICGHAHVFRDERLGGGVRWLVIDGWGGARDALRWEEGGWQPRAARSVARLPA